MTTLQARLSVVWGLEHGLIHAAQPVPVHTRRELTAKERQDRAYKAKLRAANIAAGLRHDGKPRQREYVSMAGWTEEQRKARKHQQRMAWKERHRK